MEDKNMRIGKRGVFWFFWFLAVVILIVIVYAFPQVQGTLTSTYIAHYDNVRVAEEVECYMVRDESIIYANNSGKVMYHIGDGVKVRASAKIASIGSIAYQSPITGTISYYADGYEAMFTPEHMKSLKEDEVGDLEIEIRNLVGETIEAGEPLFKMIKGNTWYMLFWTDQESVAKYQTGSTVDVILGQAKISAQIDGIVYQEDSYMIILKTNEYFSEYGSVRKMKAEIVSLDEQGLRLKSESLVTVDGEPGVYVKTLNGEYAFRPVKIYRLNGPDVLVASNFYYIQNEDGTSQRVDTVNAYDEILTRGSTRASSGENLDE